MQEQEIVRQDDEQIEKPLFYSDIIDKVKGFLLEILKKIWIPIILSGLLGYYLYNSKKKETVIYTATLSFTVNLEPISGPRSNPLYDFMNTTEVSVERMMEIMKSRQVMLKVLMTPVNINNDNDLVVNHYQKLIAKSNYRFIKMHPDSMNARQSSLINTIINTTRTKFLSYKVSPGQIIILTCKTPSEEYTFYYLRTLYKVLSDEYLTSMAERQRLAFQKLVARVDSIRAKLIASEYKIGEEHDSHQLSTTFRTEVNQRIADRDFELARMAYAEASKGLEAAKISLETSEPLMQPIDVPSLPLSADVPDPKTSLYMGCIVGFILGIFIIIARRIIVDLFKEDKRKRKEYMQRLEAQEQQKA
jgi:hypothetical protein